MGGPNWAQLQIEVDLVLRKEEKCKIMLFQQLVI